MSACNNKEEENQNPTDVPAPPQEEVYTPTTDTVNVDLSTAKRVTYLDCPRADAAATVVVDYDQNVPYARPVTITYTYPGGDRLVYCMPANFGLWKNQNGKFRVVVDQYNTVWIQGSTKAGKFYEFVFVGDPQKNGVKIKPNSYKNEIKYRK